MKKGFILLCILFFQFSLTAQELKWSAGLNYFFDNTEYAQSTLTKDQTMTGVHFSPEIGLFVDSVHSFYVGTDLLKVGGSQNFIDIAQPIAYYYYKSGNISLYTGAFPRSDLLSNYSDLFFQDSINYFRPILQGIFWQVGKGNAYFNLWLDWTGHQTATNRETFFVGASAHKKMGLFFADFQSYMFHFANTRPVTPAFSLCDNLLAHLSVGLDYSAPTGLDTLIFAVGVLAGAERNRDQINEMHIPIGAVLRLNAEYHWFGTQNTLYAGNPRDIFYSENNNGMYWNNPFLRSSFYFQSKWYLNVFKSRFINGKLSMNFHFSQGKVMSEQVFTLKAMLDNSISKKEKFKTIFATDWLGKSHLMN
jgi:hypothetical protein